MDRVPGELRDKLGIAIAKRTYKAYRRLLDSDRWLRLANTGAKPQRLLWASTGTKDPVASDILYIEALAAPFTINTIPDKTLLAFADLKWAPWLRQPVKTLPTACWKFIVRHPGPIAESGACLTSASRSPCKPSGANWRPCRVSFTSFA
jgi:hypothetical protein